jgi:hypothetical protein
VAIIGYSATSNLSARLAFFLVLAVLLFIAAAWKFVDRDARKACRRLSQIEVYVNGLVGGDETNPLSWQRQDGLVPRGYLDRLRWK